MRPSLPLLLCIAAAPAADRGPVATPTGPAQHCIRIARIRETRVRDDRTIDFILSGKRVYRNILPRDCPNLGFERRFGYATSLGDLCASDIVTVFYETPPMRGASCGLGPFRPVRLAK